MKKMNVKLKFPKLKIDEAKYQEYMRTFNTKDTQPDKIPKEIKFCKKCVGSNQRPRTDFNAEGVCNACQFAEMKFFGGIDWKKREKELIKLLDLHRSKNGQFDVIVPGSAGKDSALVSHQLKVKYGMHPLCVTWAPFIYSAIGFQNYFNMIQSGFDGFIAWPNGIIHRKLARIAFKLKGDPWEPFTFGQKALAFQMACKFKIPLIFYGENGEVEYGGSFKNVNKAYESPEDWEEHYFKGFGVDALLKEGIKMGILTEEKAKETNLELYKAPPLEEIKKIGIQMHWWSYYKLWVSQGLFASSFLTPHKQVMC
jgi:N-acetyl sugar amidotransferase